MKCAEQTAALLAQEGKYPTAPRWDSQVLSEPNVSRQIWQQLACCVGGLGGAIDPLYKSNAIHRSLK